MIPLAVAAAAASLVAAAVGYRRLSRAEPPRTAVAQAELDEAVARVDRELAANLEMTTMFDQTHQPVVLENGEFARSSDVIRRETPAAHAQAAELYSRIPATEAAMERRGPARSFKDADRLIVETWEGDARQVQAALRNASRATPVTGWSQVAARLRARRSGG